MAGILLNDSTLETDLKKLEDKIKELQASTSVKEKIDLKIQIERFQHRVETTTTSGDTRALDQPERSRLEKLRVDYFKNLAKKPSVMPEQEVPMAPSPPEEDPIDKLQAASAQVVDIINDYIRAPDPAKPGDKGGYLHGAESGKRKELKDRLQERRGYLMNGGLTGVEILNAIGTIHTAFKEFDYRLQKATSKISGTFFGLMVKKEVTIREPKKESQEALRQYSESYKSELEGVTEGIREILKAATDPDSIKTPTQPTLKK